MTNEEILNLIDAEGEDKFVAAMQALGYYVQKKQSDPIVDSSLLVTGTIRILDARGHAQVGISVIVETLQQRLKITNTDEVDYYIGVSRSTKAISITPNGVCNVKLIKGSRVRVFVENSDITREFIVPTSDFDILSVQSVAPDIYTNVIPAYQYPTRSDV